jgi:predicted NBD/HSP70 family sugar kinase
MFGSTTIAPTSTPTTTDLRRTNLSAVLRLLHEGGPQRRADLTDTTGLNRSTVLSVVDELSELGLATETTPVSDGSRGRPSAVVSANSDGVVAIGVEVAVDRARIAVIGLGGAMHRSIDIDVNPAKAGPSETARAIGEASVGVLAGRPTVIGVGIAVHGMVDHQGQLTVGPNLGWSSLDLGDAASEWQPADVPTFFGNDAALGARGEYRRGVGRERTQLFYLSAERGIGGAAITDGASQLGISGFAGEVGHMVVDRGGRRCACGSLGCWETEIGESALLRKSGRRTNNRAGAAGVLSAAREGDRRALTAVADVAGWLGFGLGNIANITDPEMIICGGYLADVLALDRPTIEKERTAVRVPRGLPGPDVVPSALGADAALVGAAELAFEHLLADPARTGDDRPKSHREAGAA